MNRNRLKHKTALNTPHAMPALTLAAALCSALTATPAARAQAAAKAPAGQAAERTAAATVLPPAPSISRGTPPYAPPPAPGTATNPQAPLTCQLVMGSAINGTGAGGAGVIQSVGQGGVGGPAVAVTAPGLATGGAWASAERAGRLRERTVNFNFAFGNLGQLISTLLPRPQPTIQYRVDRVGSTVYTGDGGPNGPHMADLSGALYGSQLNWSWNDSVTQARLATSEHFSDTWFIELGLTGQRLNTVQATAPTPFAQIVRCELPLQR